MSESTKPQYTTNPDGSVIYPLKWPFEFQNEAISELSLRRLRVIDIQEAHSKKNQLEMSVALVTASSGLTPEHILYLDSSDFGAVEKIVEDFLS